ncbi:MAG: hypothetical protein KA754_07785 [Corallincola sp.]|nr:hypothetical protein [Corallincola sp.]
MGLSGARAGISGSGLHLDSQLFLKQRPVMGSILLVFFCHCLEPDIILSTAGIDLFLGQLVTSIQFNLHVLVALCSIPLALLLRESDLSVVDSTGPKPFG